jgi:hypothetical protein
MLDNVLTGNIDLPTREGFTLVEIWGQLKVVNIQEIGQWNPLQIELVRNSPIQMLIELTKFDCSNVILTTYYTDELDERFVSHSITAKFNGFNWYI